MAVACLVLFVVTFSAVYALRDMVSVENDTRESTFVIAGDFSKDQYGQGFEGIDVYDNRTGSWVLHTQLTPDDLAYPIDWNASQFIKLRIYTWLNSTLAEVETSSEGKAKQRHNVTVYTGIPLSDSYALVFSQQNFTYVYCDTGIDPVLWLYYYDVVLNFEPQYWTSYTVTITYEVYCKQ